MHQNEAMASLHRSAAIENAATIIATAGLIAGLYAMGAGAWAACGALLLLNLNTRVTIKREGGSDGS